MKKNIRNSVLTALALAIQCAAIGWLIWRYESIVRFGTEVRFKCQAYDPYDPLRGRYLRTTVNERCTNFVGFTVDTTNMYRCRNNLYAKVEPSTNGLWRVAAVAESPQSDGSLWVEPESCSIDYSIPWSAKGKEESHEAFANRRRTSPLVATVSLPDQLFINERIAPEAEKVLRDATSRGGKGAVAVYRARDGEIVITDIEIDGKSVISLTRDAIRNK